GSGVGDAGRAAQGESETTLTDAGATVNELQVFREREPATDAGDGGRTGGDRAGGALQALSWRSQDGDVLPRIRPDVLNRLSERRREIVARYYELLARPKDTP